MDFEFESVFYEVAALLALAAGVGLLGIALRQPLVVSFIAVGILAGPGALDLVRSMEHIQLFAEIGVALLLFLVGLKLDVNLVRSLGPVAVVTGLGQIVFTSVFGFLICLGLGFDPVTAIYVAVALTFSSTIIIVKLLSDKREVDSLHGRIALGFLIVQDLAVVLAMVVLSAFGIGAAAGGSWTEILQVLASGALLVAGVWLFIRYAAEPLLQLLARAPELLVTFAIGWAVLLAALGDWLGLGKELGGLLGGVSLASSSFREAIASRLVSLRDFLLLFFFIALGARLDLSALGDQIPAALVLSAFVLVGNPLIVMAIMGVMGYRKITGFLAGLTVAQISEFSLIFIAMGLAIGHVAPSAVGLVTLVGLVTITLSTYMILYSYPLYARLEPLLGPFERKIPHREEKTGATQHAGYDAILFGVGRYGAAVAEALSARGQTILGVDFDPEALRDWRRRGFAGVYGDAGDPEFLETLPLAGAYNAVIAISPHVGGVAEADPRLTLIQALRALGYPGRIAVRVHGAAEFKRFQTAGADVALTPFVDAAERAVEKIAPAGAEGGGHDR